MIAWRKPVELRFRGNTIHLKGAKASVKNASELASIVRSIYDDWKDEDDSYNVELMTFLRGLAYGFMHGGLE